MRARRVCLASVLCGLVSFFGFGSTLPVCAASQGLTIFWLPGPATPEGLSFAPERYFEGLSGVVVGVAPADVPLLATAGGLPLDLAANETLYAFLLQDAEYANFEAPSRVLVRAGREVLVASLGEVPQLTVESDRALSGLKQPVRIDLVPRPSPAKRAGTRAPSRVVDPLVQGMVNQVAAATFVPTWQALDDFETRQTFQPNNLAATQWILETFQSYGLRAGFHYYSQTGQKRNVIATLPGGTDTTKVVYICGHLDSTTPTPSSCAPGADDNGSGIAAIIETARILSQYSFQYTVKFACFNGEEQGLVGSAAYATAMAAAGENIIAVYNCDMISYRGVDPAPADLVIYTDTASQPIATVLSNAIDTYVPGQIEPVVVVEALAASDHASFWARGYPAVCSIEDRAWGTDFNPWYHTCDDRIERYPQDYVISCAKANLAAVALTAVPIDPPVPCLVLASSTLDDDTVGGSNGNGDGIANPGETIELWAAVGNVGTQAATGVTGSLAAASPGITILNATAPWDDIPAGGQGTNTGPLRFHVATSVTDGTILGLTLTMTAGAGTWSLPLEVTAAAPRLAHYWHRISDLATGNGNGLLDPGEVVLVPLTISNRGGQDAVSVTAQATSGSPHLAVLVGSGATEGVPRGGSTELAPDLRLTVSPDAPVGEVLLVSLTISTAAGYATVSGFKLKVGAAVYDECEAEAPWSLVSPGDDAVSGLWVRGDPVGTTLSGSQCQPEEDHTPAPGTDCYVTGQGAAGGAAGAADVDGGRTSLTTPLLDLSGVAGARITYWRWFTNNLGSSPGLDPWIVRVSGDSGATWIDLENTTASANTWTERSFLVSDYLPPTSQTLVRFIATDPAPGSIVEAAVDDFEVSGTSTPVGAPDNPVAPALSLDAPRPNPSSAITRIRFALPEAGPASLQVFGLGGRLVRSLVHGDFPAGEHEIAWDGRNDSGRPVAPGVYFCRFQAGERVLSRRLTVAP